MFTGIVEEVGKIVTSGRRGDGLTLEVAGVLVTTDLQKGQSVAVNGVCLTATVVGAGRFSADASPETARRTNLGALRPGEPVNLERALRLGDRLGGHLVTGHVDGTGKIVGWRREANAWRLTLAVPSEIGSATVERGSLAVDGVSLTVTGRGPNRVELVIIPHTAEGTTLSGRKIGGVVNLEVDRLGKGGAEITWNLLAENGFV